MCNHCWDNAGRPVALTSLAIAGAMAWQRANPCGPLHIVVEDNNVDDENVNACCSEASSPEDMYLCKLLQQMTVEERWTAFMLAEYQDYFYAHIFWKPTHYHIKTGRLYKELHRGKLELTLEYHVVYEDQDHNVWVRPEKEFDDQTRFLRIA